jgi:hypothetical protein
MLPHESHRYSNRDIHFSFDDDAPGEYVFILCPLAPPVKKIRFSFLTQNGCSCIIIVQMTDNGLRRQSWHEEARD